MAFYFMGSEPSTFTAIGTVSTSTSGGRDSKWSRIALYVTAANSRYQSALDGVAPLSATESVYLSANMNAYVNVTGEGPLLGLTAVSADGTFSGGLCGVASVTNGLRLMVNGQPFGPTFSTPTQFTGKLDVAIHQDRMVLYADGNLIHQASVDLSAVTGFDNVQFLRGNNYARCSEIAVADTPLLAVRIGTNFVTADSTDTDMTGDFSSVDETVPDDADFISATAAGQKQSFTTTSLRDETTDLKPLAVAISARGREGTLAGGPKTFGAFVKIAGTDYAAGDMAMPTEFGSSPDGPQILNVDPSTGAGWTESTALDITIGLEAKA
jgi:hypothetical protein